jgi:hypothetical protein
MFVRFGDHTQKLWMSEAVECEEYSSKYCQNIVMDPNNVMGGVS